MGKNSKTETQNLSDKHLKPSFGAQTQKSTLQEFALISETLKEYFLNYTPDSLQNLAQQRLHDLEETAQDVMRYHLDFALETVDIEIDSDLPEEETSRLAQFYSRNPLFKRARDDFQDKCDALTAINSDAAFQVITHIQTTINDVVDTMRCKKQIEYINENPSPFSPASPSPRGKTHIH